MASSNISPTVRKNPADGNYVVSITAKSPTNIACIKYWGKRDTKLNLPINSSVSVTLDMQDLCTVTSVVASKSFSKDRLWLNGTEEDPSTNKRVQSVLREIRKRAGAFVDSDGNTIIASNGDWDGYNVHIVSYNTFPTAAGLASSAAGYACMVRALSALFQVSEAYAGELTTIARQGSGSACRSLYGGFVKWDMGAKEDGTDSMAVQVATKADWPEMEAIICVVNDRKKDVSSTGGMALSVETSLLLDHRAKHVVEPRLKAIEEAYRSKNFEAFGKLTMQDSNQFHATCLDTFPPIFYMNDVSRDVIQFVHKFNKSLGGIKAAYTFDAGPNAVIFCEKQTSETLIGALRTAFSPRVAPALPIRSKVFATDTVDSTKFPPALENLPGWEIGESASPVFKKYWNGAGGEIKQLIHTRVGEGSYVVKDDETLVELETGMPKKDYHKF